MLIDQPHLVVDNTAHYYFGGARAEAAGGRGSKGIELLPKLSSRGRRSQGLVAVWQRRDDEEAGGVGWEGTGLLLSTVAAVRENAK